MPMNASGVSSPPAGTYGSPGATIESGKYNEALNDIHAVVTDHVARDGRKALTGNLPFGGNKATGLEPGTAHDDAPTLRQVQSQIASQAVTVAGTVDAITINMSPATASWVSGERFSWVSSGANTSTAPTIAKDGLAAKTIKKAGGVALGAGDTGSSGYLCEGWFNGTDVILLNPSGKLIFPAGTTTSASLNIPIGVAPSSPVNGDFWMQPDGLFMRRAGYTFSFAQVDSSGYFVSRVTPFPSVAGGSGFMIPPGIDPTSPNNGDVWTTSTDFKVRLGGVTKTLLTSNQTGAAPYYAARAWVCFTGTGTVTIRGSGNVSSITDNGVGDYTINLAGALPTAEYAVSLAAAGPNYSPPLIYATTHGGVPVLKTTSQCRIRYVPTDTPFDAHTMTAMFIC